MAQLLDDMGLDAFFATSPVTMGYLAGLHEGGGERFLMLAVNAKGETRFICPGLSATQARRSGMQDVRPWNDGEDPLVHVRQLAEDWNLRSGIVAVETTCARRCSSGCKRNCRRRFSSPAKKSSPD
jgi:Xaa-Pro aminopeptidase